MIIVGPGQVKAQPLQPRAPIYITSNFGVDNFTSAGGVTPGGTGDPGNPYVIENWKIVTNSSSGIHIRNTHRFFVIRNVVVQRTNSTGESEGIYLDNVQNGRVENSDMSGFFYGIWLSLGSPNIITSSRMWDNTYGLYIATGSSETISNNHMYNNTKYGAWITSSFNSIFTGNNASENGNGICSLCDGEGFVISSNNNNLFYNNTAIANDFFGFRTIFSSGNTYKNNYVTRTQFAVIFTHSTSNTIVQNNVTNNNFGIGLEGQNSYNNITANRVISTNPGSYGVYITNGSRNIIYNNYLMTPFNAYDDWNYTIGITPNSWNVTRSIGTNILGGPVIGGNYYSDYKGNDTDSDGIGNTPYNILGGIAGHPAQDELPLFSTQPGGIYDVAITGVTVTPNNAVIGTTVSITVAVSNMGTATESFTVNMTYNLQTSSITTLIKTRSITLSAKGATSLTTTWITTGIAAGAYVIGAAASLVPGETDTPNNTRCTPPTAGQIVALTINQPPTARFAPSMKSPQTDQNVTFDASASSDPDGTITAYAWSFGDGTAGTGVTATHSYATAGTYIVSLTVTDNQGAISVAATTTLTVSQSTQPNSQPNSPVSFTLSATSGRATLTWTAPSNTGGSAIVQYRIYRGTTSSLLTWIANTTITTYEDTSVTNGQTYYYQITAVNAGGQESERSVSQNVLVPAIGSKSTADLTLILTITVAILVAAASAVVVALRRRQKIGMS